MMPRSWVVVRQKKIAYCRSTVVMSKDSLEIENQRIVGEINQHQMMLEVKPAAEGLEAPILRPSRLIITTSDIHLNPSVLA